METVVAIVVGGYVLGLTVWYVRKNSKVTVNLPGVQIEFEPPELPPPSSPPLLKGDGCDPGEDCNRQSDSH
ncbi:MAG: hypothetical protein QNJ72_33835 [Pleurocapsa sp. MO_226.B13]|nr:hypothetical protein [Pleurocapsa sp. MO_226.B13]